MTSRAARLALLPLAVVLAACFVAPLIFAVLESVTGPGSPLSLYLRIARDGYYLTVIWQTLVFGAVVTAFCALLGYPLGFAIARARGQARAILIFVVLAPLLVNVVVRSFGWMVILGGSGLVASICGMFGLTAPELMYSWVGVTIAMVHVLLPFMALSVAGAVEMIDTSLIEAAGVLGAAPRRVFWHVTLPLSVEGIVSGGILTFTLAIGSFVTVMLLGNTGTMVLPLLVYQQITSASNGPFAAALGIVLLILVSILLWLRPLVIGRRSRLA